MDKNLYNFFYPKTICIAGASSKPLSIGHELTNCILKYGFTGKLFLTNPKAESILGVKCYSDIKSINEEIDLAIILLPKNLVEEAIDDLIGKNVKSIVLITAGFKETGAEGAEREKSILKKIRENNIRLLGPNCMGLINTDEKIKLNATFVAETPQPSSIAFLSQSGALGAGILNSLRESGITFTHFISVGNKADLNENDLLDFWFEDDKIKIVTMYLESFVDGEEFVKKFLFGRKKKPVIVLKAGRTAGGMKAASSHTGALGSSDKVVDNLLEQAGVIRADNLNDLFNTAKAFDNFNIPAGNKGAVVTNAGGPAIIAVDKLEQCGLKLSVFTEETKEELRKIVHPEGSINNPVDLLPGGDAAAYKKVIETLVKDENVDFVVSIFVEPVMVKPFEVIEAINSIDTDKTIMQTAMPLPEFWKKYDEESVFHKPVFKNPEDPAIVIKNLLSFNRHTGNKRLERNLPAGLTKGMADGFLDNSKIKELFDKYNLPLVKELLLSKDELINAQLEYPVVIKAINKNIIHKSDLDCVRLNVKNKEDLLKNVDEIESSLRQKDFTVEKYLVQPFIRTKFELLVGGFNDRCFGPVIMFGTGGKYVEYVNDTKMVSAYLTGEDIDNLINNTNIGRIIKGVRGDEPVDIAKLKQIIKGLAQMLLDNPGIKEFDSNPLIVDVNNNFYIVDVRIKIENKNGIN